MRQRRTPPLRDRIELSTLRFSVSGGRPKELQIQLVACPWFDPV